MILLVPVVVALLARLARRLPLVVRYALRDASRHRTRTVPAVAAVAATVAGVVALGIGVTSDEAQNRGELPADAADGSRDWSRSGTRGPTRPRCADIVEDAVPGARAVPVAGVQESLDDGSYRMISLAPRGTSPLLDSYGGALGSSVLVSDGDLPAAAHRHVRRRRGPRAEGAGRRAAWWSFTSRDVDADTAVVTVETSDSDGRPGRPAAHGRGARRLFVRARPTSPGPQGSSPPRSPRG